MEVGRLIFKYQSHEIIKGKRKLEGLPAVYVENEDEAETLEITLEDEQIHTKIILSYTIFFTETSDYKACAVLSVNILRELHC